MTDLDRLAADVDSLLSDADDEIAHHGPTPLGRQPIHTVYVPADHVSATLVREWGEQASGLLRTYASDADALAKVLGVDVRQAAYARLVDKLTREPIEDLRIDFEDGFGDRGDDVEDSAVRDAAAGLAVMRAEGTAPPYVGIRFKSLEPRTRRRGLRTLDAFVSAFAGDGLPEGFRLTLPKVTSVEQVAAMVLACERLEEAYGFDAGALEFEIQVETPQSVLGPDGRALVAPMIGAAGGRCIGLHYGTYDYSASLGIAAAQQAMDHPAADHAKAVMQVAAASVGIAVSDGSTNVLPTGDAGSVRAAWTLHAGLVRRSLERGFYQGWDLHPGQLVSRYAATYAFFADDLPGSLRRLRAYDSGDDAGYLDEPATAAALAGYVLRALDCGATTVEEVRAVSGLDRGQLDSLARR